MTSTLTPPPAQPGPTPPSGQVPPVPGAPVPPAPGAPVPPRGSSKVIAILAICLGAVLIVGAIVTGVFSALRAAGAGTTETLTADGTAIAGLDIDVAAGELTVRYAGDEVRLEVTGNADDWRLDRDGDTVEVRTVRDWWRGWAFLDDGDVAVLTLPARLENVPLDADLTLSAGSLRADGAFGELGLDLNAGSIEVAGTAQTLDADVNAGRAEIDLADVAEADVRISAGNLTGTLSGAAPDVVAIEVNAGRLDLTLPSVDYDVSSEVSAGEFDAGGLSVDSSSPHRVHADVSAGFARLSSK